MKKLIAIACFACMGYAAQAQSAGSPRISVLTDAVSDTTNQPNATYFNNNMSGTWSVYLQATKLTGTPAGTMYLEITTDSANHYTVVDSLVLTNTSSVQYKNIYLTGKRVTKARVRTTGSGTQTTQLRTWWAKGD